MDCTAIAPSKAAKVAIRINSFRLADKNLTKLADFLPHTPISHRKQPLHLSSVLDHIEANPQETQRLIGLGYNELQILLQNAEQLHHEKQALIESQKTRIISGGGGRKPKLSIKGQTRH